MPTIKKVSTETIDFFTAECLQIHRLCDQAGIPRGQEGMVFTMSQRVAIVSSIAENLSLHMMTRPLCKHMFPAH